MTGIFNNAGRAMRRQQQARRIRRSVAHLDARLLRDTGLEAFAPGRLSRPFWWLWRRARAED